MSFKANLYNLFHIIRLKRRLEQFEQERKVERAYIDQMLVKNKYDIEERLRKDRVCVLLYIN